jgi:hypothetical protein
LNKALRGRPELRTRLEADYDAGDFAQTARLLSTEFARRRTQTIDWPSGFTKRLPIHIFNFGSSAARLNEPIILDVAAIRKHAADFNPRNFIVMTATQWITARELPSQADDLDGDGAADQIVFLADLRANEEPEYWIYYSPAGERRNPYTSGTTTLSQWLGDADGLGWESTKAAYGFTSGRIEFLAKNANSPDLSSMQNRVRALDAKDSAGLGGLAIWESGKRYPVFLASETSAMKFHHRILSNGPVRATVEVDLDDFKTDQNRYDIRERFSIGANGRYSENSISFHPAKPSTSIRFSLGFTKLRGDEYFFDSAEGYFGSWGRQSNAVQEIGQSAVFRKGAAVLKLDAKQREVAFTAPPGETSTYYLVGDWRRGRMFPVAPTVANWQSETRALAARLHSHLRTLIGKVESR